MVFGTLAEKLKADYEETIDHIEAGNQRIKAWYCDEYDPPDRYSEVETALHQYMLEQAATLIEFASGELTDPQRRMNSLANNAELILYGVGFERIGSAVHLKVAPEEFIERLDDTGRTSNFWTSWYVLLDDLDQELGEGDLAVVKLVQKIVWKQRNNEAHIGYHRHRSYQLAAILLDVASKLISHYSEEEFDAMERLLDRADESNSDDRQAPWGGEFDLDG